MSIHSSAGRGILFLFLWALFCQSATAEWKVQQSGTLAWLRSIYFVDAQHGWIAGSKGTLLTTNDGGSTWQKAKSPTGDNIWDVYFSDTRSGWLLCESDIYSAAAPHSYLLRTTDGGSHWERVSFGDSTDRLVRFIFTPDGRGFAIGEGGGIWRLDKGSWTRQELPSRFVVLGGAFVDSLSGVLVGGGGKVLLTADGGNEWTVSAMPANSGGRLNSVFFIDQKAGWAVGDRGEICATQNGGRSWKNQASGTDASLSDILFVNNNEGYAVGDNGTILETRNGGGVWTHVLAKTKNKLGRVVVTSEKGFAIGFGGTILTTERP